MADSTRIARGNILQPLIEDVEKERRLIAIGDAFDREHKEELARDRDELRRSGILPDDWTPPETNANHDYWDGWRERIGEVASQLEAAGETALAGQLLTFCGQIEGRDEVTCESDFRFEALANWLDAVMADGTDPANESKSDATTDEADGPVPPDAFQWHGQLFEGLAQKPWRLVKALWNARNRTLPVDGDLALAVWDDRETDIEGGPLESAIRTANSFLRGHDIPLKCSKTGRYVALKAAPRAEAAKSP